MVRIFFLRLHQILGSNDPFQAVILLLGLISSSLTARWSGVTTPPSRLPVTQLIECPKSVIFVHNSHEYHTSL